MPDSDFKFNKAFINLTALRNNLRAVKDVAADRQVMAMVKNDAYGHGLAACALAMVQAGADALGVADVLEGLTLRQIGLKLPLVVVGGPNGVLHMETAIKNDLTLFAYSFEQIKALSEKAAALGKPAKIYAVVNMGLHSQGLKVAQIEPLLREAQGWPNLKILGLADQLPLASLAEAHKHLKAFDGLCELTSSLGLPHTIDSTLNRPGLSGSGCSAARMVKAGIILYGVQLPEFSPINLDLRHVMTVVSRITGLRRLSAGESLGQGSFKTQAPMLAAIVPFGYSNGLMLARCNCGHVLIRGQKAPLLGQIGMGVSTYDVTGIEGISEGDIAVFLGRHGTSEIKAGQVAEWCRSLPHEVLTFFGRLNSRFFEGSDYEKYA